VKGALKHATVGTPKWYPTHSVTVTPGTRLEGLLEGKTRVNSRHHQAVRQVPAGWVESAKAPDGVNEAMELPGERFVLSVQWHPENFHGRPYSFDDIFDAFVAAASR
jgi:putative glutamine amidotransferase